MVYIYLFLQHRKEFLKIIKLKNIDIASIEK